MTLLGAPPDYSPRQTDCKSCHARIVFVRNERDRVMCLNAEPDAFMGNVEIRVDRDTGDAVARVYGPMVAHIERARGTRLYLVHHVTCPQREQWRRRR